MLPNFLIPETIVRDSGKGPDVQLPAASKQLLVTLGINRIIEQESLDVVITGSADGVNWSAKPLLRFPQKFYCGTYTMVLDLSQNPDVKFLRAEYKTNRWGRGGAEPLFGFFVVVADALSRNLTAHAAA